MIIHNRQWEALCSLVKLAGLPERPAVVVVDNDSSDGTAEAVAPAHRQVTLVAARDNLGAVGRPRRGADVLDGHPSLASVTGRILVEPGGRQDPIVAELEDPPRALARAVPWAADRSLGYRALLYSPDP